MRRWVRRSVSNRFALFQHSMYEDFPPGLRDLTHTGDSVEELLKLVEEINEFQIIDLDTLEIVKEGTAKDFCKHVSTYRVDTGVGVDPSLPENAMIVSGQWIAPGLYCSECGKRLGD